MPDDHSRYLQFTAVAVEWANEAGMPATMVLQRLCEWAVAGGFPEGAFVTATGDTIPPVDLLTSCRLVIGNGRAKIGEWTAHKDPAVEIDFLNTVLVTSRDVLQFCERTNTRPPSSLREGFRWPFGWGEQGKNAAPPECPDVDEHVVRQFADGLARGGLNHLRATIAELKGKPTRSRPRAVGSEPVNLEYWGPKWRDRRDRVEKDIHASGNKELQKDLDALDAEWVALVAEATHAAVARANAGARTVAADNVALTGATTKSAASIGESAEAEFRRTPVRMLIKRSKRLVTVDGVVRSIPKQPFELLCLLAEKAKVDDGYVSNADIGAHIWGDRYRKILRPTRDVVRELRDALVGDMDVGRSELRKKIDMHKKHGVRLRLTAEEIAFES